MIMIVICLVVYLTASQQGGFVLPFFSLSSIRDGYITGFQGPKIQFAGLEWTAGQTEGQQELSLKGTTFQFDPDDATAGECDLVGEMTSVFLPKGTKPHTLIPYEWWDSAVATENPIDTVTWDLESEEEANTTLAYQMDIYEMKWYFSISADYQEPPFVIGAKEFNNKRYVNTRIWFEFDIESYQYVANIPQVYFAIGSMRLSNIAIGGRLNKQEDVEPTPECRVNPMSKGSIRNFYYTLFNDQSSYEKGDAKYYRGRTLEPKLFVDRLYTYYTLENFGTYWGSEEWWDIQGIKKGDVVTTEWTITVFVIGEWTVKDIQDLPEDYGRTPQYRKSWFQLMLEDPNFQFFSFLGLGALIVLFLLIFAPWVLFAIFGMFKSGRKK